MEAFVDDHCFRLVHPRSLKVIEIDAIRKLGCGFLFAFYSYYGHIFSHFGDILRQRIT